MRCNSRSFSVILLVAMSFNIGVCLTVLPQEHDSKQTKAETVKKTGSNSPYDYVIGPGDLLSIRVFQQPDLSGDVRVTAQGYIRLMFIDEPIQATGHTEWELADIIREKLGVILRDPQISVQVKEAQQDMAYILGSVRTPGPVPVRSETRLLNLIASAGGLGDRAGNVAHILRSSLWTADNQENQNQAGEVKLSSVLETVNIRQMLQGRVELNKRIYPGDVVSIPEADKVFIGGNVNSPGAFELRGDLTLSQAITMAGGIKPASKKDKITIIRQEPQKTELTEVIVNLGEIEKDANKDIKLQANDVVFVPSSVTKNLGLALLNSLAIQTALLPLYIIRR